MKNYLQIVLLTILTFTSVNVLVSCGPKGNSGESAAPLAAVPPVSPAGHTGAEASGTSDSGGGSGVDGKVFESYIVDPMQLPAYKDHLAALLKNIRPEKEEGLQLENVFKLKTWYIGDFDLEKLSKDSLGVSFMKSETQQIARQTEKGIWIDKRIYDKMNLKEQAELLLHEFVMTLYFFKFMPLSEFCRMTALFSADKKDDGCLSNSAVIDKMMPPEKAHALTDEDNDNIRFVTGWILNNALAPIPIKDLTRVMFFKGFDKRFFNPDNSSDKSNQLPDIKMTKKNFYQALKGADISGNMPDVCYAVSSDKKKHCKVEIEEKKILIGTYEAAGFDIRLSVENQPPLLITLFLPDEVTLSPSRDPNGNISYNYTIVEWSSKIQVGDRLYSGFLFFKKEIGDSQTGLILESILIRPGVVVSIDKKRTPICQLRAPKPITFLDDGLSIRFENSTPNVMENFFPTMAPFAACGDSNVVE